MQTTKAGLEGQVFYFKPKYEYSISGVVVGSRTVSNRRRIPEQPASVSVTWGKLSADPSERVKYMKKLAVGDMEMVGIMVWTDSENLQKAVQTVKLGDAIRMSGFLVDVKALGQNIQAEFKQGALTQKAVWLQEMQVEDREYH